MAVIGPNKGDTVVLRLTANAVLNVQANSAGGNNDLTPGESALKGAEISKVFFSTAGNIKISRGGTLLLTLTGTDHWDLASDRAKLTENATASINVQFSDTNSSVILVLTKVYDGGQNPAMSQEITS